MSADLWGELKPRQEEIDSALSAHLTVLTRHAPPELTRAMGYSLLAPGKRLRPLLVMLACEAAGGKREESLPAGVAVEMVHTYSLIHDDLPAMDDDDLRRGLPTCHKKFGEALAILAGDALLTLAFQVLAGVNGDRTRAVSCTELAQAAGAVGMVGGQVLDLQAEGRIPAQKSEVRSQRSEVRHQRSADDQTQDDSNLTSALCPLTSGGLARLEDLHARKTGALFRAALRVGVFAAQGEQPNGPNPDTLAAAEQYATAFGLLFQVTDDLLDVESSADKAGKRVGKDAARGKLTYPGLLGVEESRRRAGELSRQAITAAERLGSPLLAQLAKYVVERDR